MLILNRIIITGLPGLDPDGATTLNVTVRKSGSLLYDHELLGSGGGGGSGDEGDDGDDDDDDDTDGLQHLSARDGACKFDVRVPVQGDIVVEFWHLPQRRAFAQSAAAPAAAAAAAAAAATTTTTATGAAAAAAAAAASAQPTPVPEPRVVFSCSFHTGCVVVVSY